MTASLPTNASQLLNQKIEEIQAYSDSNPEPITNLTVRKMDAEIKLTSFTRESGKEKSRVRFNLTVNKTYRTWSMELEIAFFCQPWLSADGTTNPPGLQFFAIDRQQTTHPIEYLPVPFSENDITLTTQEWLHFWVQKILKRPSIKVLFGHKELIASELDE